MTEQRRYAKRNVDVGESLTFDQGRFTLRYTGHTSAGRTFELKQADGGVSHRTLHAGERLCLDAGRIVVELERRYGRKARVFMDLADSVILNKPERAEDEPAGPDDGIPPAGGYVA